MDAQSLRREDWEFLDPLQQPTDGGRALYVGGFVLGDSFDTLLRRISEEYLEAAWANLSHVMEQHQLACSDLSWGWMHPGETGLPDYAEKIKEVSPSAFLGWTSREMSDLWTTIDECEYLDKELKVLEPSLRCTVTWRSLKWNIEPADFRSGLRLVEAMCTDEVLDWHPDVVLQQNVQPEDLWRRVAQALRDSNQPLFSALIEEAKQIYSPVGFRILIRGYQMYIDGGDYKGSVSLPTF